MVLMNREARLNNLWKSIMDQAKMLRERPRSLYDEILEKIDFKPDRIYLAGCGDSYYCGVSTSVAFETWTGVPTEALQALEFSRYKVQNAPNRSLLIAVSNSGKVSRTIESILFAAQRGLKTIAITHDAHSPLAAQSEIVITGNYSDVESGAGTISYMASIVTQYCLALCLGQLNGRLTSKQVKKWLTRFERLSISVERTIEACRGPLDHLASRFAPDNRLIVIGGGPNYGTALYASAKIVEAVRQNAVGQELEEWAHIQYFLTDPGTYTFVIAPPGRSLDRARELIQTISDVKGTSIAFCDKEDEQTAALADFAIPVHGDQSELLSPIPYSVPCQLFPYYMAKKFGITPGFDSKLRREVNHRTIFESGIPDRVNFFTD